MLNNKFQGIIKNYDGTTSNCNQLGINQKLLKIEF